MADEIKSLTQSDEVGPEAKTLFLGLALMNVVGEDVLKKSVAALGARILKPAAPKAALGGAATATPPAPAPPGS